MKILNVQLTVVIPERVKYDYEVINHMSQNPYIRKLVREGRVLKSYGILRTEDTETEVVVNYE